MQNDDNPLRDVDLISALHNDNQNQLATMLVQYLDGAHEYIDSGAKQLSSEYQGYLNHLLDAIKNAKFLLVEMAELEEYYDEIDDEDDDDYDDED